MRNSQRQPALFLLILAFNAPVAGATAGEKITYEKHIRPVLKAHCFQCHGEHGEREAGLDVRLRRFLVGRPFRC